MKILVATEKPFAPVAIRQMREVIEAAGFRMELLENYKKPEEFAGAVTDADAVIVRSDMVTPGILDSARQLKIVVRAGAGYDNLDLQACTDHNVIAMNTPGQNSNAVAELALGMMVYYARNFYNGKSGSELMGKKLGIHAYGYVGKNVARIAKGFGMDVCAFDPYVPKAEIEKDGVKWIGTVEELYATCNYISLHIPANSQTKQSINYLKSK